MTNNVPKWAAPDGDGLPWKNAEARDALVAQLVVAGLDAIEVLIAKETRKALRAERLAREALKRIGHLKA